MVSLNSSVRVHLRFDCEPLRSFTPCASLRWWSRRSRALSIGFEQEVFSFRFDAAGRWPRAADLHSRLRNST